jgi:hypothetical protein
MFKIGTKQNNLGLLKAMNIKKYFNFKYEGSKPVITTQNEKNNVLGGKTDLKLIKDSIEDI